MKAIVYRKYGAPEVLQLEELPIPTPKSEEILVKIHATTVTAGDCEVRRFDISPLFWIPVRIMFGIFSPRKRVLGQELAGQIESIGKDVTHFKVGDPVFAPTNVNLGAHAEYACLQANHCIALKPVNISYEEAAAIPTGGLNALHFINSLKIEQGQQILINGAGGSIGTFAVQLAKLYGAEVSAVDSSTKLEMLHSIGADHVIDFAKIDFRANGKKYDAILDVAGKKGFMKGLNSVKPKGKYLVTNPNLSALLGSIWASIFSSKKLMASLAPYNKENLYQLSELIESGKMQVVIDRTFPLEEMADAHRYVESGLKTGNVVIKIGS